MNRICLAGRLLWLMACTPLGFADASVMADVLNTPAIQVPQAQRSVILDLARADGRLVAVGERGIVLLSDDNGANWRQVEVPVSVSLTAVQFIDAKRGWAVGHAGVVLASQDGGEHWTLQLDGSKAAHGELDAAKQEATAAADSERAQVRVQTAERLVQDGADKPFLALKFTDPQHGLIVGAYGLAFVTNDGGSSWHSVMGAIDNPTGLHLYAVAQQGEHWVIAGEQGYLARSDDAGKTFKQLTSPYEGSFFALQISEGGTLLAAGLKGNAFISSDLGESFSPAPVSMPVSFSDATRMADGQLLLVNQAGALFRTGTQAALALYGKPLGMPIASVIEAADGGLVLAGFTGVMRVAPPAATASE